MKTSLEYFSKQTLDSFLFFCTSLLFYSLPSFSFPFTRDSVFGFGQSRGEGDGQKTKRTKIPAPFLIWTLFLSQLTIHLVLPSQTWVVNLQNEKMSLINDLTVHLPSTHSCLESIMPSALCLINEADVFIVGGGWGLCWMEQRHEERLCEQWTTKTKPAPLPEAWGLSLYFVASKTTQPCKPKGHTILFPTLFAPPHLTTHPSGTTSANSLECFFHKFLL